MILGDPKKAINKLAWPMIASMLLMMVYNIVDSIWVAGLGAEPLAALGFVSPLFMVLVGLSNGFGAGANSLIARYIGARNFKEAGNAAIHSIILGIILTVGVTAFTLVFLKEILILLGASSVLSYGMDYGFYIFLGTFSMILPGIFGAIFRSEGDMKRATMPIVITAVLNMILDPIFIYILNLGIAGAAIATVLSAVIGLGVMCYWMFIKKDTYLQIDLKEFKMNTKIFKDILLVAIPASIEQLIMSLLGMIINIFLVITTGATAVAVYTAAWRLISIGVMPAIGIGTAAVTVAGAAYGAKNWSKLNETTNYSMKLGSVVSVIVTILFFIFAPQIAMVFGYSSSSSNLTPLIANALRILCLFIIPIPLGSTAGFVFQGLGKGTFALILTFIREFLLVAVFAYVLGIMFLGGENGVYWGIVIGDIIGSLIAFSAIKIYLKRLKGFLTPDNAEVA